MPEDGRYDRFRKFDAEGKSKATSPVIEPEQVGTSSKPMREQHVEEHHAQSSTIEQIVTETDFNNILTPQTAADLAAAVDTINANGGGYTLQLPRALKNTDELDVSGLTLPLDIDVDDVWIRGHGPESTVLTTGGANSTVFRATAAGVSYNDLYMSDFRVSGGDAPAIDLTMWRGHIDRVYVAGPGSGTATASGFAFRGCSDSMLTRSKAIGYANGVHHLDSANQNPNRAKVMYCAFTGNGTGMVWEDAGNNATKPVTVVSAYNLIEKNDNLGLSIKGIRNPIIFADRYSRNDQNDTDNMRDVNVVGGANGASEGGWVGGMTEFDANTGTVANTDFGIDVQNVTPKNGRGLTIESAWFRDQGISGIRVRPNAPDTNIERVVYEGTSLITDQSTRTRYKEVIGGGQLGGVDLSVTTGQFDGDRAMSSGATANTGDTAYSHWMWDPSANAGAGGWVDESGNVI